VRALVLREERRPPTHQAEVGANGDVESERRLGPGWRPAGVLRLCPLPAPALSDQQGDRLHVEGLAGTAEDLGERVLAGELRAGDRGHRLGLGQCPLSRAGASHRELDGAADEGGDADEDDERDHLVGVGHGERVYGLDEEVVDQQPGGDRRADPHQHPTDHGDDEDREQVEEHLGVQVQLSLEGVQKQSRERQQDDRQGQSGELTAAAQPERPRQPLRRRLVQEVLAAQDRDGRFRHRIT
jgi:hypothetical protein